MHNIKLDWYISGHLPHYETSRIFKASERMAEQKEADILRFADRYKTRRVYSTEWIVDTGTRIDFCWKFFSFEDRSFAFDWARHCHGNVLIYNLSPLVNMPSKCLVCMSHLPNSILAEELWKTFNTCFVCHRTRPCEDARYMGETQRICPTCLDYFTKQYFIVPNGGKCEKIVKHSNVKSCADCIRGPIDLRPRPLQSRQSRDNRNTRRNYFEPEPSTDTEAKVERGTSGPLPVETRPQG